MRTVARLYSPDQKRDPRGSPTGGQFTASEKEAIAAHEAEHDTVARRNEWTKSLSPEEKIAFDEWGGSGYYAVREYESQGATAYGPKNHHLERGEHNSALINAAIARAPKEQRKLFRGIQSADKDRVAYYSQVGKEISLRALSSFSDAKEIAGEFAYGNKLTGKTGILLSVPNAKAVNVSQLTGLGEREYLLPKGTRFRVKSAVQGVQPYLRVELEQIQ